MNWTKAMDSIRILVVDDDKDDIFTVKKYIISGLQSLVEDIDEAASLDETLSMVKTHVYDLFILDHHLGGVSGLDVMDHLRNQGILSPVIFLTGHGDESLAVKALKSGATDYLSKGKLNQEMLCHSITYSLELFKSEQRRRKAESELKEKNEELEILNLMLEKTVIEEMEKCLLQEQLLIQQSKMAAMGEMIGAISHQLKQPLNAISILVHNIKDSYDYGELNADTIDSSRNDIVRQIDFMSKTIDSFRNFLKPSRERSAFNLVEAIEGVLDILSAQLRTAYIHLTINSDRKDREVMGNANEFKHVILNIVNNAKEAITEGREKGVLSRMQEGIIAIGIGERDKWVFITIEDNGGGIPQNVKDKLFTQNFTTKKDGSGIGLYISKTIIENHMGGRLYAANSSHGGAAFVIELRSAILDK